MQAFPPFLHFSDDFSTFQKLRYCSDFVFTIQDHNSLLLKYMLNIFVILISLLYLYLSFDLSFLEAIASFLLLIVFFFRFLLFV